MIAGIRATGIATLIVDRDWRRVLAHTDLAVVMEKGRIVRQGASAELLAEPDVLEELLGVEQGAASAPAPPRTSRRSPA